MGDQLSKAPIILALADIRFLPIEALDANNLLISTIQDGLRKIGYPQYLPSKMLQLVDQVIAGEDTVDIRFEPRTSSRYDFFDINRNWIITLSKNHLSVLTTEYIKWSDFRPKYEEILTCVMPLLESVQIQRVGYRTIDKICPSDGENIEDYISNKIVGGALHDIGIPGLEKSSSRSKCDLTGLINNTDKTYKYIIGCEVLNEHDNPLIIPHELVGPPPAMPHVSPKQVSRDEGTHARLSIDVIYNAENTEDLCFPFDSERLINQIQEQKECASLFFKKLVKPEKLKAWQ